MSLSQPLLQQLPYFRDSAALFSAIADQRWAVLLDSGAPGKQQGRYDIIAADPVTTLSSCHNETRIVSNTGDETLSNDDPFRLLKAQLQQHSFSPVANLPFTGGAIGYFGYDLARRLEKISVLATDAEQIPTMLIGIYHWTVIIDHQQHESWLVGHAIASDHWHNLVAQFSQLPVPENSQPFKVSSPVQANFSPDSYAQAFSKIKCYLKEGDCYQINLTQRFSATCEGNPWQAYLRLREINSAPFSAYLNLPDLRILSSSPERFLKVSQGEVETKPIKGTRPRKNDPSADQQHIDDLMHNPKDRAENLMIVDLLRNDLSKNCQPGSIKVPQLFALESYTTVHHLVSTVTGRLAADQHALDLLRSCFPGGSITGTPKIRAMEIIEELEPNTRGVYCGAIGYIGFNGNMDTNIAIRTLVQSANTIRFWAGGGIVYDSDLDAEYQESFDKAKALLQLLQEFSV